MSPNDEDGMANSVDPGSGSGSALFAQAYLSENLGSLWYVTEMPTVFEIQLRNKVIGHLALLLNLQTWSWVE